MLFVGTSIIHPSTEGVFLLCNILDLLIYRIELKTNENLVVNYLDNGDGLDNKFKNPYEIFTLGSTSKYDQFGNVIGTGLGMYIIASTVREYNGDYKLTQIQNGFGLEIRIPL